jgi:hypothetical protein
MENCSPEHDPRTCPQCSSLRHPSKQATRRALSAIPRQTRVGQRQGGGGC